MANLTLKINSETRDIEFTDGILDTVSDSESILQNIRNTLLVYKGEFEKDADHGTDYETIFSDSVTDDEIIEIIRDAIFQEQLVTEVAEIKIEHLGRQITVNFTAKLVSGEFLTSRMVI